MHMGGLQIMTPDRDLDMGMGISMGTDQVLDLGGGLLLLLLPVLNEDYMQMASLQQE